MYPDVGDDQIIEIYKQSRHKLIWGFGYFVDFVAEHNKAFPISNDDGLPHNSDEEVNFVDYFEQKLLATGAQVVWYSTPLEQRRLGAHDMGWLVVLTTGFNKTAHTPADNLITECVKSVLKRTDDPGWWPMKGFSYPPAKCESLHDLKNTTSDGVARC